MVKRAIWTIAWSLLVAIWSNAHASDGIATAKVKSARNGNNNGFQKVNFLNDFSDYKEGSVEKWMTGKGFQCERDARNRRKLDLDVSEDALVLEAKTRLHGFLINEGVDLEEYSNIMIEWGIIRYPTDASYERATNNEALMVFVFFGYDKISSGHFLIPNTPYFIGFFLGKDDAVNKPYVGRYFQKSGRFVCLGNPKPGETVVSEFDLIGAFQTYFEKDEVPVISGIALGVDTSRSGDGGKAAAFIKRIEFLE
jgi:hypothetical protein